MAKRAAARPKSRRHSAHEISLLFENVYRRLVTIEDQLVNVANKEPRFVVVPQWTMPAEIRDAIRCAMYQVLDDGNVKSAIAKMIVAKKKPAKSRSTRR